MGVQRLGGTREALYKQRNMLLFCRRENENHQSGTELFVHQTVVSAVTGAEYVSGRMSWTVLRG